MWFFLIFPTAYFLHVGYSASLFLALAPASVLAARVDRWGLAGLLGAFRWLTRAGGVVLVPSLAVEAAQKYSTNQSPVESAMVVDRTSPCRLRSLSAAQLAGDWRRIGILANAKGIVRAIVCISLGWHLENDQSAIPDAK